MKGLFPATITPFEDDNSINHQALTMLLRRNLEEGASGFFLCGSTSECFLMSNAERIACLETASEFLGRAELIAHVGAISTQDAVAMAKAAKSLGYRHLAATPPYYYAFSPREIAQYYYDISNAVGLPVFYYNFPDCTGKSIDLRNPDTRALFSSCAIEGIKHTCTDLRLFERIHALNPSLTMFIGYDELIGPAIAVGADGAVGATFNFMLPLCRQLYEAALSGDLDRACRLQERVNGITEEMYAVGFTASAKYILTRQEIAAGRPRRPFLPLDSPQTARIDQLLNRLLPE